MKKKFLIPIAGVFLMTLAFSFGESTKSATNEEMSKLFVSSDNIAFAEGGVRCRMYTGKCYVQPGVYIQNMYNVY